VLVWVWCIVKSVRRGEIAGDNPWNAPTLEWSIPSPPHHYNFARLPRVRTREPLWHDGEREHVLGASQAPVLKEPLMPSSSFWPILVAAGVTATWGLVMTGLWWAPVIGLVATTVGIFCWAFEDPFRDAGH